jgi:hypothetical protein
MVKDFGAAGAMETSMEFMTNADVPTLATDGVIEEPVNPFTGKAISSEEKGKGAFIVEKYSHAVRDNSVKLGLDDYVWLKVEDDIFDTDNWTRIDGADPRR